MGSIVYLPDGALKQLGEVTVLGKTLVTADAELTPLGVGVYWAIVSFLGFTLVYKLSRYYTPLYFKGYRQLPAHDQRDWDTRLGNVSYAVYITAMAVALLVADDYFWKPEPGPLLLRTSPAGSAALGVSVGFFAMELVVTVKYWMGGTPMVVHHVGSLACVVVSLAGEQGQSLALWMLSTEATTPFIAFRFMLDKAGLKSHPLYIVNGLTIVAVWTVARLATFPPFFLTVYRNRAELRLISPPALFLALAFPALLAVLNVMWYMRIVRGALKVLGPKRKPAAKKE